MQIFHVKNQICTWKYKFNTFQLSFNSEILWKWILNKDHALEIVNVIQVI